MITRTTGLKEITKRISRNDISIFIGDALCEEAYLNDRDNNFYIYSNYSIGLSFALGIALSTDKRVFVFSSDNLFLSDVSTSLQMAVSGCKNLFYVLFNSDVHLKAGGHPNIFSSLSHPQGMFFRMGFTSFVFDHFFSTVGGLKEMGEVMSTLIGPVVIFVSVSKKMGNRSLIDKPMSFFIKRLKNNLKVESTSLYNPPNINDIELVK